MPDLTEAYKGVTIRLLRAPMDLTSMDKVPETHAWAGLDDDEYLINLDPNIGYCSLPTIDISLPSSNSELTNRVFRSCKEWGVFQVINHGISTQLFEQMESHGRRLFELPMQQKMKTLRPNDGVSGYGLSRISPFFDKLMWYEGFTIAGSPLPHASLLWPHDKDQTRQFCDVVEEYQAQVRGLSAKVMDLVIASLGLREADFKWTSDNYEGTFGALQFNSYPVCPQPSKAMGLAEHTDSSMLTLLYLGGVPGLQVLKGDRWLRVAPNPSAITVHVGDLLQIVSNGLFHSVMHRALVNQTRHRVSYAYHWGPPGDTDICPHPKLVDEDHPARYRSIKWHEYLKLKAEHYIGALTLLATSQ